MKQFTSILFGLILAMEIQQANAIETQATCTSKFKDDVNSCSTCCESVNGGVNVTSQGQFGPVVSENPIYRNCVNACSSIKSDTKEANSTNKQVCSEAMKEYKKAIESNPCKPGNGSTKTCYDQIAACQASTGVIGSQNFFGDENLDNLTNSTLEMIKATQANQNSTNGFQPDRSCYKALKVGDKEARKERKSRKDQIKKDIESADKERREANEKLAKETNEVKVEQQKLQAETTKAIQKLDIEKREKLTKMNEEIQKAGTDIRKQTTEIIKTKQAMEKLKFENQKTMMAYTEEKINQQCKSALTTAKMCFIKASKGTKFAKDDTCSNFSFSGSGTKGTAELKKKLKQVQDACFEQSNQAVSTLKYEYADKIRTYEMDIKEKQEQIADANKALEAKKTENEAINKETEAQKSQEQKNLEEQMSNFTEKLANLQKSTEAALKSSELKIADLNLELKDLEAGILASEAGDGSQSVYDNQANAALGQLDEISRTTSDAFNSCCVEATVKSKKTAVSKPGLSAPCSSLYQDIKSEEKRSSEKVKAEGRK